MATIEEQVKKLQAQKDANSAAWHTATTQADKDALHQENVRLSQKIDEISGSTSTFDSGTGKWTRREATATPAVQSAGVKAYDNSEYLRKQAAAEKEAALAGLKGAYTQSMAAYDAQQDKLPERYQAARNDAAAQSAMAKKAFDERAAASGLNSGASGQAALDTSAVYRGNISNLNQAQASDLAEIDRAKAALTAQYETAVAQANAEGDASLAKALYQELIRVQGLEREDEQIAYDRGRDTLTDSRYDQQYADSRADVEYDRKLQTAATMAQFGNFSGYADLWGLPQETVDAMVAEYAQQKQTTQAQAARDLADWYAQYGDFSQLKSLGVNTSVMEKQQALALSGKTGSIVSDNQKKKLSVEDIYQMAKDSGGDPKAYLALNYAALGIPYNQITTFQAGYDDWAASQPTETSQQRGDDYGLSALNAKLALLEDGGSAKTLPTRAAQAIKQAFEGGQITEATARRLLAQYGISGV